MADFDGIKTALDVVTAALNADYNTHLATVATAHGIECDPLVDVRDDGGGTWQYPLGLVYMVEGRIEDAGLLTVTPVVMLDVTWMNPDAEYRQKQAVAYLTAAVRCLAKRAGTSGDYSYDIAPRGFAFDAPRKVENTDATVQTVSLEMAVTVVG